MAITVKRRLYLLCVIVLIPALSAFAAESQSSETASSVLTHADAALLFAKYSGMFDRYIAQDATLNDCVAFLNDAGIYFGLLEVVSRREFTVKDCARVMGQMNLLFSGEAEYLGGKVKLPKDIDSWEAFCTMNDIQYVNGYEALVAALRATHKINR